MVFIITDNHVKTSYLTTIIIHHFINQSLMRKDQMMNHHWWYFVKNWYRKMYSHSVPVKPELSNFFGGNWQLNIDLLESKHLFLSFQDLKKMSKNAQTSFCVSETDSICTCFRLWIARRFDNLKFRVNNIVLRLSWKSFRSGDISWI